MISYLKGKIIIKDSNFVIVDIGGLGYKVFLNESFLNELNVGNDLELYTYLNVREDALDLYGFKSSDEEMFFELLISVSGVGPKSALSALSIAIVKDLIDSISREDSSLLVKVSGIGQKTAQRIVLELATKVSKLPNFTQTDYSSSTNSQIEEIEALLALGYSQQQARDALRSVDPEINDSGERVKEALKNV